MEPGVTASQMTPAGKAQTASVAGAKRKSRAMPDSPESNDENASGAANSSQPTKKQRARTALVKMEVAEQATPSGTPGATLPCLGLTLPELPVCGWFVAWASRAAQLAEKSLRTQ